MYLLCMCIYMYIYTCTSGGDRIIWRCGLWYKGQSQHISECSNLPQISHCALYTMCCGVGERYGDEDTGEINDDLRDS